MTHIYMPERREATCGVSQSAARSMTRSRRRPAALPGSDASSVPSRARARRLHSPSGRACPREPRPFAGARSHQRPAWSPPAPRGGAEGSARLQRGHGPRLRSGCSGVQRGGAGAHLLALLEHLEGGHRTDAVLRLQVLALVHVHLRPHTHTNRQGVCSHTGAAARVRARATCAWLASGW